MKKKMQAIPAILILALTFGAAFAQSGPPVRFTNMVAVGDSLAAGFQSGVLRSSGQQNSFPALIARQARTYFFLPLVTDPGFGQEISLVNGNLVVGPPVSGAPGDPRVFPLVVPQNLAVPGQDTFEALTVRPANPPDTLEDVLLGLPSLLTDQIPELSQIEWAVGLQPTLTLFWLGSNDVLGAALAGDASLATPLPAFQQAYTMALGAVATLTTSRVVVANIPDVTVIAYLTPAETIAAQAGAPLAAIGPILGIGAGDLVTAPGIPLVSAILTGQTAGPLPPNVVLTAQEVATLRTLTAQMNGFIGAIAAQLNVPVVDINGRLNDIDQNGYQAGPFRLTTDFLGGLFSLDGFHPTNTGQAIVANAFIERMNAFYGSNVPVVDVAAIAARDPLVPRAPAVGPPAIMAMTQQVYDQAIKPLFEPNPASAAFGKGPARGDRHEMNWLFQRLDEYLATFPRIEISPGPYAGGLSISVEEACHLPQTSEGPAMVRGGPDQ